MKRLGYKILLGGLMTFFVSSCVKDTCNGELGNTFYDIEEDSLTLDDSTNLTVHFSTSTLDDLPASYFEAILFSDSDTESKTIAVTATKSSIAVTLPNSLLPEEGEGEEFLLNYVFGDRSNHIDCQHPGSTDSYFLELSFEIFNLGEDLYFIIDFDWNEIFAAGHL